MKKLHTLSFLVITALLFFSCSEDQVGPVINSEPGSPEITAPEAGKSYVLTEETADDTLLTLKWTEPDYGFQAATEFVVQMSKPDANFADPIKVGTTHNTSFSLTVAGINNSLLTAGFAPGQQAEMAFRVVASISDSLAAKVSEPLTLAFTPYEVIINYPEIYVPGSYQAASGYTSNWAPTEAPALYSVESNNKYEGYVYMAEPDNAFKFTDERSWDLNWGDTGADGTLEKNSPDNIQLTDAGYYKINVDLNALTYKTLKTTWGVIGSATPSGWDSDTDMTYHPDTKVWTVTVDLKVGEIKFRANGAWDLSYGDKDGDSYLDQKDGNNISIDKAGTYKIILNLSQAPYSYKLIKK